MKRRTFVTAATTGSAALAAPVIARAQSQIKWRLASSWPKNLDTIYGAAEVMSKRVAEATGGRFDIQVAGPGELVPAFQVADAVQQGTVECCHTASGFFYGKDPTFAFDNSVAFGLTSRQMTSWIYQGDGAELMREFYRDYNIVSFPCGNTGTQMAGWFRKELKSLEDVKGLKFRSGAFGGSVWQLLDVVPQNIPGGEIYTALERGTIDGAEFVGPYDDERLGLHKTARYYYYPSFVEPCGQIVLYVNAKALDALPKDYRQILELACAYAHTDMQAKYDVRNPQALKRIVAGGVQLRHLPRDIVETAYTRSWEMYEDLASKNPRWKKVLDAYVRFRDDQIQWARFSESGYDNMVAAVRSAQARARAGSK